MFGIFYALFGGTMRGAGKIKDAVQDEQDRQDAEKKGKLTYWHYGKKRYVKNGRQVREKQDVEGNLQIVDMYNGTVYHTIENVQNKKHREEAEKLRQQGKKYIEAKANITLEKREQLKKKYFLFKEINDPFRIFNIVEEIKTGRLFNEIKIGDMKCYIDLNTGFIVDTDKEKSEANGLTAKEIIEKFNSAQQKRRAKIFNEKEGYGACEDYFIIPTQLLSYSINECVIDTDGKVYFLKGGLEERSKFHRELVDQGKLFKYSVKLKSESNVEVY